MFKGRLKTCFPVFRRPFFIKADYSSLCASSFSTATSTATDSSLKVPLVDGVCPAMRGSYSAAMRRARPKALNTVSA